MNNSNRRPRLLYVITEDWFFASHFLARGTAAVQAGFDVAVATRMRDKVPLIESRGIRVFPLEFSRRGLNPIREIQTALQLGRIVRAFGPDIVHNVALKPVVTGTLGERFFGCPCIINAPVGMGYVFTAQGPGSVMMRLALRPLLRLVLRAAPGCVIIENADDGRDLVASGLVRSSAIRLVRGAGVDTRLFSFRPEPPEPITVLLVARMLRDKGVREFVGAAKVVRTECPEARFLLVGEPDPDNPSSLSPAEIRRWVHEGHVEFLGFREDVADLLASCHVACLPSYREGLPKALLEAAAAGRPIVATDVPGCREIVAHGVNGILVPPRDVPALASAIRSLIMDGRLRAALGAAGRSRAVAEFSDEVVIQQTLQIYRECLSQ